MGSVSYDFDDEVAIVTGGSSGIGRATVLAFARAGATVINADLVEVPSDSRYTEPVQQAATDFAGSVHYVETDVTEPNDIRTVVDSATEFGGVNIMVNNAGMLSRASVCDVSPETFDRTMAVNARGVLLGCQAAAEDMCRRDDPGVIINTASINSNHAMKGNIAYIASKGAVQMITYAAALDLAETGIRVNAVAPGIVATGLTEASVADIKQRAAESGYIKDIPLGRAASPDEITGAILFLATDASSYVTGELFHIDGGWHTF